MAAIYWHPDGYDTVGAKLLMGRHSAGEGFLRGYLRHGSAPNATLWNVANQPLEAAEKIVRRIEPSDKPLHWVARGDFRKLAQAGVVYVPAPGLGQHAWYRRVSGDRSFSLCGVTHTVATGRILDILGDFPIAPVQPWDAVVCTSLQGLAALKAAAEMMTVHLEERLGARRITWPQYVHIPLGVNADLFAHNPDARRTWREELAIADNDVVVLYFGRLNAAHKAAPGPMALALERAASRTSRKVHWVLCGKMEHEKDPYEQAIRKLCSKVQLHFIDGRRAEASSIWSASDIFISFSDNIQETFGLTPVEAMAAGLPCVVSDWDGYKGSVRNGIDGFRIPTYTPSAGRGLDLAMAHGQDWIKYATYVGAVAQFTAVDIEAGAKALLELIENPELRRRMGESGRQRVLEVFDWGRLIPQYEALWTELDTRRKAAPADPPRPRNALDNPFRPDPFQMFASYPTEWVTASTMLTAAPNLTWEAAEAIMATEQVRLVPQYLPSLEEVRQVFKALAGFSQIELGELLQDFPLPRRVIVERGVVWMAKFGLLNIMGRTASIPE